MSKEPHRIAILSDTHGLLRPEVIEALKGCEIILHGGDINSPKIVEQLEQIAPLYVVRGNNDREWADKMAKELELTLFGLHIYMVHNKKHGKTKLQGTDIFIYGHSHKYEEKTVDGVLFLNPGSCGPRRFKLPVTMAVLEVYDSTGQWKGNGTESHGSIGKQQDGTDRWRVVKIDLTESEKAGEKQCIRREKAVVESILRGMSAGRSVDAIADKLGLECGFVEQVCRIYVTHPGVDAQGIVDKMEVNALLDK